MWFADLLNERVIMKAILQRCLNASVIADGTQAGKIDGGLFILLGVMKGDEKRDAELLAEKISKLRIFDDDDGKLNLSLKDVGGAALVVSNFTLGADYKKGNRPDYFASESPVPAKELYEYFCQVMESKGIHTEAGVFGADMKISMTADGPVTIAMDSTVLR